MNMEDHARKLIEDMNDFTIAQTILVRRQDEILFEGKDPETAVEYSRELDLVSDAITAMEDHILEAKRELIGLVNRLSGDNTASEGEQQ